LFGTAQWERISNTKQTSSNCDFASNTSKIKSRKSRISRGRFPNAEYAPFSIIGDRNASLRVSKEWSHSNLMPETTKWQRTRKGIPDPLNTTKW
jgi:hypothetical protein